MKVTKNVIEKIKNHEGYQKKELFTIRLDKELYTFYINKLVCWIANEDRQYLSVYHFTSEKQKQKNAWNNSILFSQEGSIPYSNLDMVSLSKKEFKTLQKYHKDILNLMPYDIN